jgi:hypothetical protein
MYLDAEALKEGIILANETQTNVEFELKDRVIIVKMK